MNTAAQTPTPETVPAGKTTAIINPTASSGAAKKRWDHVHEALAVHFPGLEVRFTEAAGHATELCREALEAGADTILSVGGDGTTNEVLSGFVDEHGANRFPDAILAILAAGTGGDFQRMFGRRRMRRQVERLCCVQPRTVDYGIARYTDPSGQTRSRPFLNVASVGVSGEVVRRVNSSDSQLGPTLKYVLGSLKGIRAWRNVQVRMKFDDQPEDQRIDLTLGIVANGQYFGAGMWVAPGAKIDDGRFDAVTVEGMSRTKLTATLAKVFGGNHMRTKGISHKHATAVEFVPVSDEADVPIEIDGEQVGRLPARFELRAAALKIRIS
ncbi:Transcription regulator [Enhygromyxa salina]|uniref:Transcription regulator n=1 Tax=Enhygromyxa salina TaxID=215803 RepID=A0A0C1ZK83_9BACT|nr:YegS/Rv2252/BmrU family lipid kinase [Enhygromyxa salina]KIG17884.1 Transcription regulator [Enhygromyxa salina]